MHPAKAPGPYGMSIDFYPKFCTVVGEDVIKVSLEFLNYERFCPKRNYTHLVMIPKMQTPKGMSQFHPISLCNVIYKVMSMY